MPNTYTYTKSLAEQVCESYKDQLPISIVRPSIVIGTEREPMPGWNYNFNGPVGLMVGGGVGILRTLFGSPDDELNCVSVDIAIKGMIVASWVTANRQNLGHNDNSLEIYNSSTYVQKMRNIVENPEYLIEKNLLKNILWVPGGHLTTCKYYYNLRVRS